jgi:hypothetical protein
MWSRVYMPKKKKKNINNKRKEVTNSADVRV